MIHDISSTTTFPDYDGPYGGYTLDEAYWEAQESLWTTFFGDLISWALFACLFIQVYFYFLNFPHDRRLIKGTVLLLFVIEIGATAFLTWTGFVTHIVHWGHAVAFMPGTWGSMIFDCTIASIVHALYAWRIYKLIARRWMAISLALFIMLLSMAQFSCCFAAAMFSALQQIQGPGKQFVARKLFHSWLALATSADIIITTVMAIKLFSARTGVRSTDTAITKLLYVTIPGGAITAFVTLLILVIQMRYTGSNYYQILIISLTKFYSNSVLVCLNLRASKVTGAGRHTMLTGFQTDNHVTSSRMPFDIKVERNVEKFTSSGVLSNFHCDQVGNSSEYGVEEDCRTAREYRPGVDYPVSIHTLPNVGFRTTSEKPMISIAHSPISDDAYECHPFRSSESVKMEVPAYDQSVSSVVSMQASPGHHRLQVEEGQSDMEEQQQQQPKQHDGRLTHSPSKVTFDKQLTKPDASTR